MPVSLLSGMVSAESWFNANADFSMLTTPLPIVTPVSWLRINASLPNNLPHVGRVYSSYQFLHGLLRLLSAHTINP